ncbi:MAG: thioredoxin family protein [Candidatus Sumerlaeia bacterium]|nr:thioredoxin family protein [Candidatus Sumerlaeia bacterium]
MPRPPILPTLDWKTIFNSGVDYSTWLAQAENPDHLRQMKEIQAATVVFPQERAFLQALPKHVHLVVIAEDWCGDVVRNVPALEALIQGCGTVHSRYITREQHPQVFARYLTNGGEAIPKIIFLSQEFVETGNWGPMTTQQRLHISRGKAAGNVAAARKIVGALYNADTGRREVVAELLDAIDVAATASISAPA